MPSRPETLQPTPFEPARPEPEQAPPSTGGAMPRWVLPALGGLLVLAALVVFWLPQQVEERAVPDESVADSPGSASASAASPGAASPAAAAPDRSPWSDAQQARLRKDAQDVLAELLDLQFSLQERGVEQWGAEPFAAVAATAALGDELYRQREYEAATARYQEGLAQLQQLQDALPSEVDRQLERARTGIEAGDIEAVQAALDLAELMDPDNPSLAPLRDRLSVLPRLAELLALAAGAEQVGDLKTAEQRLQQAASLDAEHQRAASELARVSDAYRQQQFNDAMTEGYSALDAGHFDGARTAFRRASQLQPGSGEAASALQEVEAAATAHRLASLKRLGRQHEQEERWQQAVSAYEQAQKIDASVLFASEGLQRSRGRARLDRQFTDAIEEPGRLSDEKVARAMEALLAQARAISPRGPVLDRQIERLEQLLALANTPITVTLRSDMATEVIVYKVARLGQFDQRELSLRPGTYTAVGQRDGYRDVRREFTIAHDSEPAPVTIACTEPI